MDDHGLSDLRFKGYGNEALAQQVDGLRNGAGATSLHDAAGALVALAAGLAETDQVLREQLRQIGVSWQGEAGEGGARATQAAAVYADDAVRPVGESAKGVTTQSGEFSHTRNSAPDSGTLRGPTQLNGWDRFTGTFGHTTDHARQVQATGAARDQAVAGLTGYQAGSSDALGRVRTLPVPPGMDLVIESPDGGTRVSSVGGVRAGGPGLFPGGGGQAGASGPPGGLPLTGGTAPGIPGAPEPGQGGAGGQPGGRSAVGPVPPLATGLPAAAAQQGLPRGVPSLFVAEAAALAGAGAQGAAVGAGAEKDRLVRGRQGGQGAQGSPGIPGETEEGRGNQKGNQPKAGAAPVAAVPDEEARPARNAERFGAKPAKPATSAFLQPAATGAVGEEEDTEHVRRYGIDSGDLFEDGRMTSPSLIGDDEN